MHECGEGALLARARGGDRAAFDALQAVLEPAVRRFTWRLVGNSSAGDDIVHRVMLALYLNLERLDAPERLRPFVFRVVRNLCYSELRRQGRFDTVSLDDAAAQSQPALRALADARAGPDEALHWAMLYGEVQRAMDALPEPQRQALILHAEEGLTYEQVADVLDADLGTVKSRIHYARRNLRRRLAPETREALGLEKET